MRTEDLINKVITGNATAQEKRVLNNWLNKSEANQKQFDQQELMWNLIAKVEKESSSDVDAAWMRFVETKEQIIERPSKLMYKIAAVLIVLLTAGSIGSYVFFNSNNQTLSKIAKVIVPKEKIERKSTSEAAQLFAKEEIKNTRFLKQTKRNDTSAPFVEYVLIDSSTVKLNNNSALKFLDYSPNHSRVASLVGAGVFDIKPSNQLFILETDHIIVHVEGTKFNISAATEENPFVEIFVEEGSMEVFDKENLDNTVSLTSGQKYLFDTRNRTFNQVLTSTPEMSKWKKFWKKFNKN